MLFNFFLAYVRNINLKFNQHGNKKSKKESCPEKKSSQSEEENFEKEIKKNPALLRGFFYPVF